MKTNLIILLLVIVLTSAGAWAYFVKNDKKLNAKNSPETANINTVNSEEPLELIDPSDEENNEYILAQLASVGLEPNTVKNHSDAASKALREIEISEAALAQNTTTITEPTPEIAAGPFEAREFDESESEEDLIKRLSKQTGMSEAEIREAFKGQ